MKHKIALLTLLLTVPFVLTACGEAKEAPEEVLPKFQDAMSAVDSGIMSGDIRISGGTGDELNATMSFKTTFDYRDAEAQKSAIELGLKGSVGAPPERFSGDIALGVITIGVSDFYLNLSKLESDHATVTQIKPFLSGYLGKWLHLPSDLIPENVREAQRNQQENRQAIRKLLTDSSFFAVDKEYGVEAVNGQKAYHYGVTLDRNGIQEYVRQLSILNGRELTATEIEDSAAIASSVTSAEVWIGTKDYHLYKAKASINSNDLPAIGGQPNVPMRFELTLNASDYNKNVKVEAPEDSEEFNPLALLMGLGGAQGLGGGASPLSTPAPDTSQVDTTELDALLQENTP